MDFSFAVTREDITRNHVNRLLCGDRKYLPATHNSMKNTGNLWDGLRRDVHAMAVTMYQLMFGTTFISPSNLSRLPLPLREVLSKALSSNFKNKHPDGIAFYEEFHEAVEKVKASLTIPAPGLTQSPVVP